jgi:hypothetical protein
MSAIRLACQGCDNIGYPSANGDKTGFTMDIMTMTLVNMQHHGDGSLADIVGNEPVENPVERVAQAAPKGGLTCDVCGSTEVEIKFEVDMIQERKEDDVVEELEMSDIEDIDNDDLFDDSEIEGSMTLDVDDLELSSPETLQLDKNLFQDGGQP